MPPVYGPGAFFVSNYVCASRHTGLNARLLCAGLPLGTLAIWTAARS